MLLYSKTDIILQKLEQTGQSLTKEVITTRDAEANLACRG